MSNIIEAKNIHKLFGKGDLVTHVLKGIDITVKENEFLGIMGKSGAGKSTLLYQLSALDHPSEGEIYIAGTNILQFSEKELVAFRLYTLGYIFQDYALVPDLSAEENVLLPLLMRGIDWHTAEATARDTLAAVGLKNKESNLPAQLSGGEQQRVAIARAIAGKPKILFADEPTANLDSISGRAIIQLLVRLHREGQTVVMVTHENEYAENCDRIVYLEDGLVVSEKNNAKPDPAPQVPAAYVNPVFTALEKVTVSTPTVSSEIISPTPLHIGTRPLSTYAPHIQN